MDHQSLLRIWAIGAFCCTIIALFAYALMPPAKDSFLQSTIIWFVWPGVALWSLLGGSLFGSGGFGKLGDFVIIVLGSAFAWSIPVLLFTRGVAHLRQRRRGAS
jgi:hypothetical protein